MEKITDSVLFNGLQMLNAVTGFESLYIAYVYINGVVRLVVRIDGKKELECVVGTPKKVGAWIVKKANEEVISLTKEFCFSPALAPIVFIADSY